MEWDFRHVLANVPAALFRGYADGSVDFFDRKVEAMTGYTKEELESRRTKWTDHIFEADRDQAKRAFVEALKTGKAYTREYRFRGKAGNLIWIHERS